MKSVEGISAAIFLSCTILLIPSCDRQSKTVGARIYLQSDTCLIIGLHVETHDFGPSDSFFNVNVMCRIDENSADYGVFRVLEARSPDYFSVNLNSPTDGSENLSVSIDYCEETVVMPDDVLANFDTYLGHFPYDVDIDIFLGKDESLCVDRAVQAACGQAGGLLGDGICGDVIDGDEAR